MPEQDRVLCDAWCDRIGWTPKVTDLDHKKLNSTFELVKLPDEDMALNEMTLHVIELSSDPEAIPACGGVPKIVYSTIKAFTHVKYNKKRYKEVRSRIYRASVNWAMFVTSKGFIGLAPWNARKGDSILVLLGGCTPFISCLRLWAFPVKVADSLVA